MTITPIGPSSPISNSPEERAENNRLLEKARQTPCEAHDERVARVEFSPDAQRIREKQAEITRLQMAIKAVDDFRRDAEEIDRFAREDRNMRTDSGARKELDERIQSARAKIQDAGFDGKVIFDGSERKIGGNDDKAIQFPDGAREMDEFEREARKSIAENRQTVDSQTVKRLEKFRERALNARDDIASDIRDSVEKVVRESSSSRFRDAAQAEDAIRRARSESYAKRPKSFEQISRRAVDLLR